MPINNEQEWAKAAAAVGAYAHKKGLIKSAEAVPIPPDEVNKFFGWGSFIWGTNSRVKALRANKLLGWKPTDQGLFETIPSAVDVEEQKSEKFGGFKGKVTGESAATK